MRINTGKIPNAAGKPAGLFTRLTGNSLFLLLAGALMSSLVVPYITSVSVKNRLLQENRLNMQREIIKNGILTDRQINAILTRLELYHKDNYRLKPGKRELKAVQNRLQDEINRMYLNFDDNAWWWHRGLYQEAAMLNLTTKESLDSLLSDMGKYQGNIVTSTNVLSGLWGKCLSAGYDYDGNCSRSIESDSTREKLLALRNERNILITKLAGYLK